MRGIGRFVAFAAKRRRGEVGGVGFHEDAVNRSRGKDIAQVLTFGKGGDAGHGQIKAEIEGRPRQLLDDEKQCMTQA